MNLPERKTIRLKGYDYSQNGAYFVTLCVKNKHNVFGKIVGDGLCAVPKTELSDIGVEVEKSILYINTYQYVNVDKYVVMPNHIHLIISICNEKTGQADIDIFEIMKRLKSFTTRIFGGELWQRSYFDHIIRGQQDYDEIWQYIDENPIRWIMRKTKGRNSNG